MSVSNAKIDNSKELNSTYWNYVPELTKDFLIARVEILILFGNWYQFHDFAKRNYELIRAASFH